MILLTGATGFLGKHLVDELLAAGYELRLLVRNPAKRKLPWKSMVEIAEGDINDTDSLSQAMEGVQTVIHAAAIVSFWKKRRDEIMKVNVEGTANIVNACLDFEVEQLIHISSIAAMGKGDVKKVITENTAWVPNKHNSQYAVSKYKAELEVHRGIAEGLNAIMVNPGVILGPDDQWDQGTPKMFSITDKGLKYYNRGGSGWVGVNDVTQAILILLNQHVEPGNRFLLVAENLTQHEIFSEIAVQLGKKAPHIALSPTLTLFAGYVSEFMANFSGKEPIITSQSMRNSGRRYQYDGSKITKLGLEYTPIKEVIRETVAAYRKTNPA